MSSCRLVYDELRRLRTITCSGNAPTTLCKALPWYTKPICGWRGKICRNGKIAPTFSGLPPT